MRNQKNHFTCSVSNGNVIPTIQYQVETKGSIANTAWTTWKRFGSHSAIITVHHTSDELWRFNRRCAFCHIYTVVVCIRSTSCQPPSYWPCNKWNWYVWYRKHRYLGINLLNAKTKGIWAQCDIHAASDFSIINASFSVYRFPFCVSLCLIPEWVSVCVCVCPFTVHCELGEWTSWGRCVQNKSIRPHRRGKESLPREVLQSPRVRWPPC